jgi:hypothetical protein
MSQENISAVDTPFLNKKDAYKKRRASSLLAACYNHNGANVPLETLDESLLEGEFPRIGSDDEHAALFRFLDEAIFLVHIGHMCAFAASVKAIKKREDCEKHRAVISALFAVKQTASAIRVLQTSGLDAASRQNLRALQEQCVVLCRLLVDKGFMLEYLASTDDRKANEFWHKFVSKGKCEKFFMECVDAGGEPCLLLLGDDHESFVSLLSVSTHSNVLGFSFEQEDRFKSAPRGDMLNLGIEGSTEFVLFHAARILFTTVAQCFPKISADVPNLGLLVRNPLFDGVLSDGEAIQRISRIAGLALLMMIKLMNRANPSFNGELHF